MRKTIGKLFLILMLLVIYAPILILAVYSFTDSGNIGSIHGFSMQNYVTLFTKGELRDMIVGTVLLALVSSLLATILGTMGAIGAFYSKKLAKNFINTANQIPVVNADVVTGFSICVLLIVAFGMNKESYVPLLIGHVVLSAPFVYLSVVPKLKQMDASLYEAAMDLGASPSMALRKVVIPQIMPGIVSGFALAITLSLDDYFIASYTKPATFNTISTYVVNATKGSQTEIKTALWALSTVIFLIVILAVVVMNVAGRKTTSEKGGVRNEMLKRATAVAAATMMTFLAMVPGTKITHAQGNDDVIKLRVCNWEEYIDLGDWDEEERMELENGAEIFGENSMVDDFTEWYYETYGKRVEVEYSCFGTNEDLYNQLTLGDVYDLLCPSD